MGDEYIDCCATCTLFSVCFGEKEMEEMPILKFYGWCDSFKRSNSIYHERFVNDVEEMNENR